MFGDRVYGAPPDPLAGLMGWTKCKGVGRDSGEGEGTREKSLLRGDGNKIKG